VAVVLAVCSACVVDVDLPPAAEVACASGVTCPPGYVCRPRIGRCLPEAGSDTTPPTLQGTPSLVPAAGTLGTRFELTFQASEPLLGHPHVRAEHGGRALVFVMDESRTRQTEGHYTYTYLTTGEESEGEAHVLADLVDRGGNLSPSVALGSVRFDFGAPRLLRTALTAGHASAGRRLELELAFDEALAAPPDVRMRTEQPPAEPIPWSQTEQDGMRYSFAFTPTGQEDEGRYAVAIRARDEAGNETEEPEADVVVLDFTPPTLVKAECRPRRAAPGDILQVDAELSEEIADRPGLVARSQVGAELGFELADWSGAQASFRHVVLAGEEGERSVVLSGLRDLAGNQGESVVLCEVTFDETAPSVVDFSTAPPGAPGRTVYNGSDRLEVAFGVDEPLGEPPSVLLGSRPLDCGPAAPLEGPFRCALLLSDSDLDGSYPITVGLSDRVGNRRTVEVATTEVDTTPPSLVDVTVAPRLAGLGTATTLVVQASETLAGPPSLAWRGDAAAWPSFEYSGTTGLTHVYRLTVDEGTPEGLHRLHGVTLTDVAGNGGEHEVDPDRLVLEVDRRPPALGPLAPGASVYSRRPGFDHVTVVFDLGEALGADGSGLEGRFVETPMVCGEEADGPGRHACEHTVGEEDREGAALVRVTARDAAGNTTRASTTVRLDYTGPTLVPGTARLLLVPGPDNPLASVPTAGIGTTVRVSFSVDEPLLEAPDVVSTRNGLVFEPTVHAGTYFVLEHTLRAGEAAEGADTLRVKLVDQVGNTVRHTLDAEELRVFVDTEPPPAPDVEAPDRVVFVRKPWGDAEQPERVVLRVVGEPGAAVAGGTLLVYDGAGEERTEIGRTMVDGEGGFDLDLQPPDRTEVWVALADEAGNGSPLVRVRDVEWVASMGLEEAGEPVPNPHSFTNLSIWQETLVPDPDLGVADVGGEPLLRIGDGVENRNQGRLAWRRQHVGRRSTPTALRRCDTAVAYDAARGRLVLFGGLSGQDRDLGDTWEWDGRDWHELDLDRSPPPRSDHAMAYGRGRVVLFGGQGPDGPTNDHWEWDGVRWRQQPAEGAPPARIWSAMAYDAARGQVVLFGGWGGDELGDTWTWDGGEWAQHEPGISPAARRGHALAYDAGRERIVLFAGYDGDDYLDDVWEWDGHRWYEVRPPDGPPGRQNHALAYDPERRQVVLYGGWAGEKLGDTWEWDGRRWTEHAPPRSPPPMSRYAMTYDGARRSVVLFGGDGETRRFGDLWAWDGATWTRLGPEPLPVGRQEHAMAYDGVQERVIVFGGRTDRGCLRDTMAWDGRSWQRLVTPEAPPAGCDAAMAPDGDGVLLFGGSDGDDSFGETWEWDGKAWRRHEVDPVPPARLGLALAYDEGRGRVVLFGGRAGGRLDDTWEWDGERWHRMDPAHAPPARDGHGLAYDPQSRRSLLFGGEGDDGHLRDTWAWDGRDWHLLRPDRMPRARRDHVLAADPDSGAVLMFGGRTVGARRNDTWVWDGLRWSVREPPQKPDYRTGAGMAYDGARRRMVLFGGQSLLFVELDDTWEWNGTEWHEAGADEGPSARRSAMAWHGGLGGVVLFGGYREGSFQDDTWLWDGAVWHRLLPDSRPLGRHGHALAYDSVRDRVVLHGGTCIVGELADTGIESVGDTWEWDGHDWEHREHANGPPPRANHALAFDSARQRVVLFGGRISGGPSGGDTWEWDGQEWHDVGPPVHPSARSSHALAYDAVRGKVVLFGGSGAGPTADHTWEWDGEQWVEHVVDPSPLARSEHQMVFDPTRRAVILFGGLGGGTRLGDTWEWDGSEWRELAPEVAPPVRDRAAMAYDADRSAVVVFGGGPWGQELGDTWTLPSGRADRPGQRFTVDLDAAGLPPGTAHLALTVTLSTGGVGYLAEERVPGARLLAWRADLGRWLSLADNGDGVEPPAGPDLLRWSAGDGAGIAALRLHGRLHFGLVPVGRNGEGPAELATDYAEAVLRCRLP